ncbi:alpha/beta fold hydrolase [Georgenia sunbinii]|uniref:alpha/beta fold hydrolase n=1 Tax=Georgenia sunbinii TaxID=3117728 RepID=UPI002F26D0DD
MATTALALHHHGPRTGLPLVLLHGFPLDSRMWDGVLAELAGDIRVIAVDAPGFGDSPLPGDVAAAVDRPDEPSLETFADAVAQSLAAVEVRRAVVAGLSMGGYAALALAERHRGLIAGIALLDTKATGDDDDARAGRLRVAQDAEERGSAAVTGMVGTVLGETTRAERPDVVERLRDLLAQAPGPSIAWAQRAMAVRPTRLTALEDLSVPGLVLRGAEDAMSPQDAAEAMARALGGGSELAVVPRAGHLSAMEDPGAVAEVLRRFYERVA